MAADFIPPTEPPAQAIRWRPGDLVRPRHEEDRRFVLDERGRPPLTGDVVWDEGREWLFDGAEWLPYPECDTRPNAPPREPRPTVTTGYSTAGAAGSTSSSGAPTTFPDWVHSSAERLQSAADRCSSAGGPISQFPFGVFTTEGRLSEEERARLRHQLEQAASRPGQIVVLEDGMRYTPAGVVEYPDRATALLAALALPTPQGEYGHQWHARLLAAFRERDAVPWGAFADWCNEKGYHYWEDIAREFVAGIDGRPG